MRSEGRQAEMSRCEMQALAIGLRDSRPPPELPGRRIHVLISTVSSASWREFSSCCCWFPGRLLVPNGIDPQVIQLLHILAVAGRLGRLNLPGAEHIILLATRSSSASGEEEIAALGGNLGHGSSRVVPVLLEASHPAASHLSTRLDIQHEGKTLKQGKGVEAGPPAGAVRLGR